MPLQQISLDQSIYNKKPKWGTNVQGAGGVQGSQSGGGTRYGGNFDTSNSFVEKQKAEWAAEDKQKKLEREQQMQKAQEIGMQVANQIQKGQQQQQTQAAKAREMVEADPEKAAQEMYNLMLTLPDEAKTQLLNQLFTPTSSGSSMSSGAKTINMPSKYNPLANVFLEKGWAMFDAKGNVNLSEPEKEAVKDTFKTVEHDGNLYSFDTSTGKEELLVKGSDIPEGITTDQLTEVFKEAADWALGAVDPSYLETLSPEAKENYYSMLDTTYEKRVAWLLKNTYNLTLAEATKIANGIPPLDKSSIEGTGGETGDTEIAYRIYDVVSKKENISEEEKQYYIDNYGEDTWAIVERKLSEDTGDGGQQTSGGKQTKKPYIGTTDLEDYSTEGIINKLKNGIPSSKEVPESKWKELSKKIDIWMDKTFSKKLFKENPEAKKRLEEYKKELENMQPGSVPELIKNIDAWIKKVSSTKIFKENPKAKENLKKYKEGLSKINEKGQPDWSKEIDDFIKKLSSTKVFK